MFQKGEFRKITLEMIIFLEFTNSMRFGLVNRRVLCLHMFHQTSPWPSIVPFSPMKKQLEKQNGRQVYDMMFGIEKCSSILRFSIYYMSKKPTPYIDLRSSTATYSNSHKEIKHYTFMRHISSYILSVSFSSMQHLVNDRGLCNY